jgi:hypothetical protein
MSQGKEKRMHTYSNYCRGDLASLEEIRNYSLVVKDGEGIRYPAGSDDLRFADIYFVVNIPTDGNHPNFTIEEGKMARCFKVRNDFMI